MQALLEMNPSSYAFVNRERFLDGRKGSNDKPIPIAVPMIEWENVVME